MEASRYQQVTWYLDRATGEYVAMVPSDDGSGVVEVDRVPTLRAVGGTGSPAERVPAVEDAVDIRAGWGQPDGPEPASTGV